MISCSFLYCTHSMYVILHIRSWAAALSSSPQSIFKMWWGDGSSTVCCGNVHYKKMYAVLFRRVYVLLIVFLYFYEKSWVWENQKPEQQPPPPQTKNQTDQKWMCFAEVLNLWTYCKTDLSAETHKEMALWYIWHCGREARRASSLPFLLIISSYEQYIRQQSFLWS